MKSTRLTGLPSRYKQRKLRHERLDTLKWKKCPRCEVIRRRDCFVWLKQYATAYDQTIDHVVCFKCSMTTLLRRYRRRYQALDKLFLDGDYDFDCARERWLIYS